MFFIFKDRTTERLANMPLYEYKCTRCGHEFEALQRVKDKPLAMCPKCGGALRKLISPPAIQFKGRGWYITDYAKKSSSPSADKAEARAEPQPGAAREKKSPPKPEPSSAD